MSLKKTLSVLTSSGALLLVLVGFTACAPSRSDQAASPSSAQNSAQNPGMPMSGGDNGSSMPMPGMDHGAMMSMGLGPKDENLDLRFIDAMILHHQGAVVMAEAALEKSNRPEIKKLAQDIIAAQQTEIQQMQDWRKAWYPSAGQQPMMYHEQMGHMMPMPEEMQAGMMMNVDLGAGDDQFDLRFINAMIPHHEGALMMAQEVLEKSDRAEIKQLAENVLKTQKVEIEQMKQWRQQWYNQ